MVNYIKNAYTQDQDRHPMAMNEAYKFLTNWKKYPRKMIHIFRDPHSNNSQELEFVNVDKQILDRYSHYDCC